MATAKRRRIVAGWPSRSLAILGRHGSSPHEGILVMHVYLLHPDFIAVIVADRQRPTRRSTSPECRIPRAVIAADRFRDS
jgi:hypothetical protein